MTTGSPTPPRRCLSCDATDFTEEEGRIASKWNASSHLVRLFICTTCGFVMTFYTKRSRVTD